MSAGCCDQCFHLFQTRPELFGDASQLFVVDFVVGVLVSGALGVVAIQTLGLTERRREFGLRLALGASSQDLALQLLTESFIVCIFGTVCGLAILSASLRWLEWDRGLQPVDERLPWLLAATGVSFAINVGCALWPPFREARRPPHAALAS